MKKILSVLCLSFAVDLAYAADRGVLHTAESPHVKFKSINIGDAQWTKGFWADKFKLAEKTMIPHMGTILKGDIGHGYNNFKIAAGLKKGQHKGFPWHDGDTYKWMESTMYLYAINRDEKILAELDEMIQIIGMAQREDGYLSTFNIIKGIKPFTNRKYHELYNSGHLLTSGVMHRRITGKTNFFDIAVKHADYLYKLFQPRPKHLARFGFNQSQIMGLVELYRETKDKRYLELAEIFINMRGAPDVAVEPDPTVRFFMVGDMVQERTPFREETDAVGHAVLAMYFYAGAADVYGETGEQALLDALQRVWSSSNERKMYLTGAVGQVHHGASGRQDMVHEAFLDDYMMPNATAYNETCANIANAMFNWRMLSILGEAKFADSMETVIYNSGLSGISADGKQYYYTNPLRKAEGIWDYSKTTTEHDHRQDYLECFCCPPNLVRTIAKLSGWAYSLSENGIAVNLYGGNQLDTELLDGSRLRLTQETQYPWDGRMTFTIQEAKSKPFDVLLRIPGWANGAKIRVNGKALDVAATSGSFAKINRQWVSGDVITLDLPMSVALVEGHPRIEEVRNQVAVRRGPIVYAVESPDLPKGTSILDVYISGKTKFDVKYQSDFLGGLTTLKANILIREDEGDGMYRQVVKPKFKSHKATFIPYYAWSNRGTAEMTVFMPVLW